MVSYAIGEELESQTHFKEALECYAEAERKFPLAKYKDMARSAQARIQGKLVEHELKAAPVSPIKRDLMRHDPRETLFIVACTKNKIWDEDPHAPTYVPARYAYRGESFREFTTWLEENEAESKGFRWLILSAKHGYIEPWHPIGNYDVTFNDETTGPISDDTLHSQVMYQKRWSDNCPLRGFKVVRCFGSRTYVEKVRKSLRDTNAEVREG